MKTFATLRAPGVYDPGIRLRGAVYAPKQIELEGVKLREFEY